MNITFFEPSLFQSVTGLDLYFPHFIAGIVVYGLLTLVCIGVLQDRYRRRRRLLLTIPRDEMPVLRMRDVSKVSLEASLMVCAGTCLRICFTEIQAACGDRNSQFQKFNNTTNN